MDEIIEKDIEGILSKIDFSSLANKTILVTGASGLVGLYFISTLKKVATNVPNLRVVATFKSEPEEYFKRILDFNEIEVFRGDITSEIFLKSLPESDIIIHAAGYGQPLKFMDAPELTLKLNTLSVFYLFEKLKPNGSFLFLSSSELYSSLDVHKYREDEIGVSNTTHARACYIEGKRTGETICNIYFNKGLKAHSIRLAHTYGPGARKGDKRVILSFIEKALKGKIEMLDKGEMVRTYCYVADAVEMMWNVLLFGKEPIYNVCGDSNTTIAELAGLIGKEMNVPVSFPSTNTGVSGAPPNVELDISRYELEFNKKEFIPLEEGLKRTINWYLNEYGINK